MVAGHGRRARIPRRSIAPERLANGTGRGGPSTRRRESATRAHATSLDLPAGRRQHHRVRARDI
jgi:hypothetical protein